MSKLLIIVVLSLVSSFSLVCVASANGAAINRGKCMSQIDSSLSRYQAPGQVGNGPMTVVTTVNGVMVITTSFDGSVGCVR